MMNPAFRPVQLDTRTPALLDTMLSTKQIWPELATPIRAFLETEEKILSDKFQPEKTQALIAAAARTAAEAMIAARDQKTTEADGELKTERAALARDIAAAREIPANESLESLHRRGVAETAALRQTVQCSNDRALIAALGDVFSKGLPGSTAIGQLAGNALEIGRIADRALLDGYPDRIEAVLLEAELRLGKLAAIEQRDKKGSTAMGEYIRIQTDAKKWRASQKESAAAGQRRRFEEEHQNHIDKIERQFSLAVEKFAFGDVVKSLRTQGLRQKFDAAMPPSKVRVAPYFDRLR